MFKSIGDIFNSTEAIFNDPLYEIHNPVRPCEDPPEIQEYEEFMDNLDISAYPRPIDKYAHNTVNILHGALKSVY